ncbi:hypothetical protein RM704_23170 [Streptomyces sp. DSM 3412]|uniref:Uncharacterized protein n=1 Tax=Streptomyces gottesmaniae TaxID=3075518 RepID=A0ABU2Z236_9ACTN|nr:hypothetical protein [Streptomyces sp. DSM 3412]MDT0570334.1 hypothetical protein [Streptomyces sp. DSM 3412]
MDTPIYGPTESAEEAYQAELTAFARDLKDLQLACNITYRQIGNRSPIKLSPSGIADTLRGKRLPSRDYLNTLIRVLYEAQDGKPVGHDDPRPRRWEERRTRLLLLRDRAQQSGAGVSGHDTLAGDSLPTDTAYVPPPDGATLLELESAKSDLRDILDNLEEHQRQVRTEFRQVLDEQARVKEELGRLTSLLEQERGDKERLTRKIASLKRERAKLGKQLDDLRAQFAEIDADKVALLKEESDLNDRRAVLNFDWARYEELLRQRANAEVSRLREELDRTRTDPPT